MPNEPTMSKGKGCLKDFEIKRATTIFDTELGDIKAIKRYLKKRKQLLSEETKDGWDCQVRSQDKDEKRAAIIIREIQEYEQEFLFDNIASEALPGPETRDMGGQFLTNKKRIENKSKLYKIAREVPKGALLHSTSTLSLIRNSFLSKPGRQRICTFAVPGLCLSKKISN
jgi:hypothetical protein